MLIETKFLKDRSDCGKMNRNQAQEDKERCSKMRRWRNEIRRKFRCLVMIREGSVVDQEMNDSESGLDVHLELQQTDSDLISEQREEQKETCLSWLRKFRRDFEVNQESDQFHTSSKQSFMMQWWSPSSKLRCSLGRKNSSFEFWFLVASPTWSSSWSCDSVEIVQWADWAFLIFWLPFQLALCLQMPCFLGLVSWIEPVFAVLLFIRVAQYLDVVASAHQAVRKALEGKGNLGDV